ncbi:MAG: sugar phosphate isomerase/epimerase family protein [Chloroflexota bacterium]|nr:sugar phosphate isomerase/epimerase family protein [Chloroflexota bacterium]
MYICMHNWMRPEPIERTIQRLSSLGYDGIQIMGEPRKYDWKHVKNLLDQHNLKCFGSVSIMLSGRDLIHADPYYRIMTVTYLKECLDMVGALGGTMFTLVPSEVGKVVAMADAESEWAWAVQGVREVAQHAAGHGIRIGLEPLNRFETNFLNRHDQAIKLAEDVGEPNVGVCLDAFHINIEEADMYQAILNTGKHLVDFHVADNNRRPPGEGSLDWHKLITTLRQAGYTEGPLTAEFVVPFDRSPLAAKMEAAGTEATDAELKFIRDHGSDLMSDAAYTAHCEAAIKHLRASGA